MYQLLNIKAKPYYANAKFQGIFWYVFIAKFICATLFMYVFSLHFTILDQFGYLKPRSDLLHFSTSTHLTRLFFSNLNIVCFSFLPLVLIVTSFLSAFSFTKIFLYVKSIDRKIGYGFAALMFLPSYFIFTSVPGKELLIQLFFTPIVLSIFSYFTCDQQPNKFLTIICMAMLVWFKPIYIIPLLFSYGLVWLLNGKVFSKRIAADLKFLLLIFTIFFFLLLSWSLFSFYKLHILDVAHKTFDVLGRTQTHKGFVPDFLDYLNLSFSFINLTYGTDISGFSLWLCVMESAYLIGICLYYVSSHAKILVRMPLVVFLSSFFAAFIIAFFQLPYSLWNLGTALRYRCDIYLLFITWFFIPFIYVRCSPKFGRNRDTVC